MLVETQGFLIACRVDPAGISDRRAARGLTDGLAPLWPKIHTVIADAGYESKALAGEMKDRNDWHLRIVKRQEQAFKIAGLNWIVERSFAWLGRHRGMSKDYEYSVQTSETLVTIAASASWLLASQHSRRGSGRPETARSKIGRRCAALSLLSGALICAAGERNAMAAPQTIIDALDQEPPYATIGTRWEFIADRVMGGVSAGEMVRETVVGRPALRLRGEVSLENDGGFVQIALNLVPGGDVLDASHWTGIAMDVFGNGERYNLHFRTSDVVRPWQSYRADFVATPEWRTVLLPFASFEPHRIEAPLDLSCLRRLGIVAIGRAFTADVAIGRLQFYR